MSEKFPVQPWEFMVAAREVLGIPAMLRVFGPYNGQQIYRWGRNPQTSEDSQGGPLVWLASLFRLLTEAGQRDLAFAGLRLLAEPCGARVETSEAEAPDDLRPVSAAADCQELLVRVVRLARDGADPKEVDQAAAELSRAVLFLAESHRREARGGTAARWSRECPAEQELAGTFMERKNRRPWWKRLRG